MIRPKDRLPRDASPFDEFVFGVLDFPVFLFRGEQGEAARREDVVVARMILLEDEMGPMGVFDVKP